MHARRRAEISIVIALLAASCAACGRRGGLQPPDGRADVERSSSAVPASARSLPQGTGLASGAAAPDPEAVRDGDELPVAAPPAGTNAPVQTTKGGKRGYTIPKGPFILDPIL